MTKKKKKYIFFSRTLDLNKDDEEIARDTYFLTRFFRHLALMVSDFLQSERRIILSKYIFMHVTKSVGYASNTENFLHH